MEARSINHSGVVQWQDSWLLPSRLGFESLRQSRGPVAQWSVHWLVKPGYAGSSPVRPAMRLSFNG